MAGEATDAKASGVRSWSGTLGSEIGRTVPATGTYVVRVLTMWREVTGTA